MSLARKVAVITASSKGIGYAIAKKLGLDGAKVVISSRKLEHVNEALRTLQAEGITAAGTTCHVAKHADRQQLLKTAVDNFGSLDIVVSNAGISPHFGPLLDVSEEVWDKLFEVNVKAGFLLGKMAVPYMEQTGGSIVYVSSIGGYAPFQGIAAYSITKTALLGLTKAMAQTCAAKNIRVNCIAPGIIKTDFSRMLWDNDGAMDPTMKELIPLGRYGTPEDCAGAVSFLCSNNAAYITGETILISGGINARL